MPSTNAPRSLAQLAALGTEALRKHRDAEEIPTDVLREVAEIVVEARSHFITKDGTPDWRGVTYPYRKWNSEMMSAAGLRDDVQARAQATIRYHVGNILRERLDDEQLANAGLKRSSPRERAIAWRGMRSDLWRLFSAGPKVTDAEDQAMLFEALTQALRRIDPDSIKANAKRDPDHAEAWRVLLAEQERLAPAAVAAGDAAGKRARRKVTK